mgnify:CR=1 FL=1
MPHQDLDWHKKYGPMVRVGPHHVCISDRAAMSTIYSISTKFVKVSLIPLYCIYPNIDGKDQPSDKLQSGFYTPPGFKYKVKPIDMEMGTIVPQLLREFVVEWASAESDWTVRTYFFSMQEGLIVRLQPRRTGDEQRKSVI